MISYKYAEKKIIEYMSFLNGKVNRNKCHRYDFWPGCENAPAYEHFGSISFFPSKLIQTYGEYPMKVFNGMLLVIICHELSHIDQDIDYTKYHLDDNYRREVENGCNLNAYRFICKNISILHAALGEFDELVIDDISKDINFNRDRYIIASNAKKVFYLIRDYFVNNVSEEEFNSLKYIQITLGYNLLHSGTIIAKKDNLMTDFNELAPVLYSTSLANKLSIRNTITDNNLLIAVLADTQVYNRVIDRMIV